MRTIALAAVALAAFIGSSAAQSAPEKSELRVRICHRTASAAKPYLLITVTTRAALAGHRRHAADIIPAPAGGCPRHPLSPTQGGTELKATLTGSAEVPGPGDSDGSGAASIRLMSGLGRLCFSLSVMNITLPATGAHIHVGAAGVAGNVVVPLQAPGSGGTSAGCVNVPRTLVAQILANPAGYYVNVHTTDFPNGAIRGQLA